MANLNDVNTMMAEAEAEVEFYITQLAAENEVSLNGFEDRVAALHEAIQTLPHAEALEFEAGIARLIANLDVLAEKLQAQKKQVKEHIESLNVQMRAQAAYKKANQSEKP